jgi:hypothetical protein
LVLNLNRHQTDGLVEVASFLTLRAGHRYEWGDAASAANVTLAPGTEVAALRRHVAVAGAGLRLGSSLDFSLDLEAAAGDRTFFRTDLADYERARLRGRYHWSRALTFTGAFAILNNRNAAPGIDLEYQGRQTSLAVLLTPGDGRRWSLALDYTRATIRSSLPYLEPQDRVRLISTYREDGHYGNAMATLHLWPRARIDLGASLAFAAGSRPTRYYQPQARFLAPVWGKLAWQAEWRWFGFTERRYAFENFHAHLLATGLQFGF